MEQPEKAPRRRLLKRGALLLGGAAGIGLLSRGASLETPGTSSGKVSMALRGSDWRLTSPDRRSGVLPQPGAREIGRASCRERVLSLV